MPLPGAVLFPHALLPLYIFEPRYRKMLEHALQRHRMFCVTLIKPIAHVSNGATARRIWSCKVCNVCASPL
jgi:Lon protease-like protein